MITTRTLPSFRRFDTSARAGGFVMDRFLTGVRPQEFFFHCMAGREGLIDTAVKTARSGYLQRCLMKCMESLVVGYDYTVRDRADGSVIQFTYGEDALDVCKTPYLSRFNFWLNNFDAFVERYNLRDSVQKYTAASLASSSTQEEDDHQEKHEDEEDEDEEATKERLKKQRREQRHRGAKDIQECARLIDECLAEPSKHDPLMSQFLPSERLGLVSEKFQSQLNAFIAAQSASPSDPLARPRTQRRFRGLMSLKYSRSFVNPGEPVGVLAAQSIGEPSTQMTLNTFHLAGRGDMNVTLGMPRLKELLMSAKVDIATPSMTIALRTRDRRPFESDDVDRACTTKVAQLLSRLTLLDIVQDVKLTELLRVEDGKRLRCYEIDILFKKDYQRTVFDEYEIPRDEFHQLAVLFEKRLRALVAKQLHRSATDASIGITAAQREDYAGGGGDGDDDGDEEDDEGRSSSSSSSRARKSRGGDDGDDDDEEKKERKKRQRSHDEEDDAENVRAKRKMAKQFDEESDSEKESDLDSDASDREDERMRNEDDEEEEKEKKKEHSEDEDEEEDDEGVKGRKKEQEAHDTLSITITMAASDKVMMMQLVEECIEKTVLHECKGIKRCFVSEADPKPTEPDQSRYVVQTEGVNFVAVMVLAEQLRQSTRLPCRIDVDSVSSNDVHKVLQFYGVEAARSVLVREVGGVFKAYGINVDPRHLSLIGDYMTFDGGYRSYSRNGSGMACHPSPLLQISFETAGNFLINAATFNRTDNLRTPAASLVVGLPVQTGTGAYFQSEQVLDPAVLEKLQAPDGVDAAAVVAVKQQPLKEEDDQQVRAVKRERPLKKERV